MAFEPKMYKAAQPKPLPVILMLDGSGSMSSKGKIESLNEAVQKMIHTFSQQTQRGMEIWVAIIVFKESSAYVHTEYTPVQELEDKGFEPLTANGRTPMGGALKLAKEIIEDKSKTPSRAYRPAAVLVSDGAPTDEWQQPMEAFMEGRSAKCQRFVMPIGPEADQSKPLQLFLGDEYIENRYYACEAQDIALAFNEITMSISQRAVSKDPNAILQKRAQTSAATPTEPKQEQNELLPDDVSMPF